MSGIIQTDVGGIVPTIYHWDEHADTIHVERQFDAEPLIELHKSMQAHGADGWNADRSGVAIADVPITLLEECRKEGWDPLLPDNNARFLQLLQQKYPAFLIGKQGWMQNGVIVKGAR